MIITKLSFGRKKLLMQTWIPDPSGTVIFHTQFRLLRYGSGKPGDKMVPVRWVRLPPHGTAGKKQRLLFTVLFFPPLNLYDLITIKMLMYFKTTQLVWSTWRSKHTQTHTNTHIICPACSAHRHIWWQCRASVTAVSCVCECVSVYTCGYHHMRVCVYVCVYLWPSAVSATCVLHGWTLLCCYEALAGSPHLCQTNKSLTLKWKRLRHNTRQETK